MNLCKVCIGNSFKSRLNAFKVYFVLNVNNGLAVCVKLRSTLNCVYSVKELVDYSVLSVNVCNVLIEVLPVFSFSVCEDSDLSACSVCYGDVCCDVTGVNLCSCEVNSYVANFPPLLISCSGVGSLEVVGVNSNSCVVCCVLEYLCTVAKLYESVTCCERFLSESCNCCSVYVVKEDIRAVTCPAVSDGSCASCVSIPAAVSCIPCCERFDLISAVGLKVAERACETAFVCTSVIFENVLCGSVFINGNVDEVFACNDFVARTRTGCGRVGSEDCVVDACVFNVPKNRCAGSYFECLNACCTVYGGDSVNILVCGCINYCCGCAGSVDVEVCKLCYAVAAETIDEAEVVAVRNVCTNVIYVVYNIIEE